MKKKIIILASLVLIAISISPVLALAQSGGVNPQGNITTCTGTENNIGNFLCIVSRILNQVVPILIGLAVIYFIWGVVQYVIASDEEAKKTGRNRMIWGIIGLAVILAMWGLAAMLTNTFGINNNQDITLPTVPLTY